jgi:hypothetical protein
MAGAVSNLLWLEPLIVARLEERFAPDVRVFTAPDLDGVEERKQVTPAVHVLYGGSTPANQVPGEVLLEQTWTVVAAARSVRDVRSGSTARSAAGEIVTGVIQGLLGWRPGPGVRPLELQSAPPSQYRFGFIYIPVTFNARFALIGDL